MLVVLISDFLVRGYDDQNLIDIPPQAVRTYLTMMLAVLTMTVLATSFVGNKRTEYLLRGVSREIILDTGVWRFILLVCLSLLTFELLKRLSTVDWSISEVVKQSLGARGRRTWDLAAYKGNFVFALSTIFLPFAAMGLGFLSASPCNLFTRLILLLLFIFAVIVLVTDGSRTPVALVLVSFAMFWSQKLKSRISKIVVFCSVGLATVLAFSLMRAYRALGFVTENPGIYNREFHVMYHQDDSYYRAVAAFYRADATTERWDALHYMYAIVANPIPRFFWPDKPLLDQEFYGGYKLDYVTTTFMGEIVAMTGVEGALPVTLIVAFLFYIMFFASLRLLQYPFGLAGYLILALYTYMILRSSLNLTHFVYLPLFAWMVLRAANSMMRGGSPALHAPGSIHGSPRSR